MNKQKMVQKGGLAFCNSFLPPSSSNITPPLTAHDIKILYLLLEEPQQQTFEDQIQLIAAPPLSRNMTEIEEDQHKITVPGAKISCSSTMDTFENCDHENKSAKTAFPFQILPGALLNRDPKQTENMGYYYEEEHKSGECPPSLSSHQASCAKRKRSLEQQVHSKNNVNIAFENFDPCLVERRDLVLAPDDDALARQEQHQFTTQGQEKKRRLLHHDSSSIPRMPAASKTSKGHQKKDSDARPCAGSQPPSAVELPITELTKAVTGETPSVHCSSSCDDSANQHVVHEFPKGTTNRRRNHGGAGASSLEGGSPLIPNSIQTEDDKKSSISESRSIIVATREGKARLVSNASDFLEDGTSLPRPLSSSSHENSSASGQVLHHHAHGNYTTSSRSLEDSCFWQPPHAAVSSTKKGNVDGSTSFLQNRSDVGKTISASKDTTVNDARKGVPSSSSYKISNRSTVSAGASIGGEQQDTASTDDASGKEEGRQEEEVRPNIFSENEAVDSWQAFMDKHDKDNHDEGEHQHNDRCVASSASSPSAWQQQNSKKISYHGTISNPTTASSSNRHQPPFYKNQHQTPSSSLSYSSPYYMTTQQHLESSSYYHGFPGNGESVKGAASTKGDNGRHLVMRSSGTMMYPPAKNTYDPAPPHRQQHHGHGHTSSKDYHNDYPHNHAGQQNFQQYPRPRSSSISREEFIAASSGASHSSFPPLPPLNEAHYLNEEGEHLYGAYHTPTHTITANDTKENDPSHHGGRGGHRRNTPEHQVNRGEEYHDYGHHKCSASYGRHYDHHHYHYKHNHGSGHNVIEPKAGRTRSGSPSSLSSSFTSNHVVQHPPQQSCGPLQPYYNRQILCLSTDDDENWLSEFLCFVRSQCVEVFSASQEDVASRMNSKKVLLGQVGIRCRFCAHIPHRERTGRSSSFPSSINRIYQSLTMMLRDHFTKCHAMPPQMQERYLSLKANASQGATDSKKYWIESAHTLGLIDTDEGMRFCRPVAEQGAAGDHA